LHLPVKALILAAVKEHGFQEFLNPSVTRFASYNGWIRDTFRSRAIEDQKLVFIFVDAFGWLFFERFRRGSSLLQRFEREGTAELAHSQFPSTTACHVTTAHFGLPVAETGIFEWNYFEPLADAVISPLLFSVAGDRERETLSLRGLTGREVFPFPSFYETLRGDGIPSFVFQFSGYSDSSFSREATRGATTVAHENERQALENLAGAVKRHRGPGYFFLYLDSLDSTAHHFGPNSEEANAAGRAVLQNIEELLVRPLSGVGGIKLLISADHGQSEVSAARTLYLDKELPECLQWFKTSSMGLPLVAGGSMRDFFLYVKPESHAAAMETLSNRLGAIAHVRDTASMIGEGYFGAPGSITPRFRERMADIVILPFPGEAVWWSGNGIFEKDFKGMHGGLSREEFQITRLVIDL